MTKETKTFEVTRRGRRSGVEQTDMVQAMTKQEAKRAAKEAFPFRGRWGSEATTVTKVEEVR